MGDEINILGALGSREVLVIKGYLYSTYQPALDQGQPRVIQPMTRYASDLPDPVIVTKEIKEVWP